MDTLTGSIERITYYNPENGYSVVRVRPEQGKPRSTDRDGLVTVTGNLPELSPGEFLRLQGNWNNHPRHGLQFQVEQCEQIMPATLAGMRRYLGSGLVKGIGPKLAQRIVGHFGIQTLEVIENQAERLVEVPDIGQHRSRLIARAWDEQKQVKEVMLALHSHGVSTNLAVKIYKQYGEQSLAVVNSDPYRLAQDIHGVGFKTADRIARALGLALDHPSRIEAGLTYALSEMSNEGHVYSPVQHLAEKASTLLEVSLDLIPPAIERLESQGHIRRDFVPTVGSSQSKSPSVHKISENREIQKDPAVYLTPFYFSESATAERLNALAYAIPTRLSDLPASFYSIDSTLSTEQQEAIHTALVHPVSVITGGPGTGKTTCLRALIEVLDNAHKRYALASPTGRAARRLAEATGRPASTIHRLLGYSPGQGFRHGTDAPLDLDLLVVDEASMLDLLLTNHLLKALSPGTHLLFVGDIDQLPSVGAGDVLRDIIASQVAPVSRLSKIYRQSSGSQIITNAYRINQGKMPVFQSSGTGDSIGGGNDFFLFPAETAEDAGRWTQEVVCERIPRKFGFDPLKQIQVLAPMYRGPAGVHALNGRLQSVLNPSSPVKPEKVFFGQLFRLGDKVMQVQNNYDKDIYNGDIGWITAFDPVGQTLVVDIDGRRVSYDWSEADQLVLAYAVSVHKSQGSEFPVVVAPLVTAHYMMLQRNLLYTAVTRAQKLCVLVGSSRAIAIAVKNDHVSHRYTALGWRLQSGF